MSDKPLLIGHRGCAGQYPENTVTAFRRAGRRLDAVEVDVRRCGSGELIAFHDEHLQRITGYSGTTEDTEWNQIAKLEVFDSSEKIPLFETVVDAWPAGVTMNLDIHDANIVRDALSIASDLNEAIILSSTSEDVLTAANGSATEVHLGYSFRDGVNAGVRLATELGCRYVHVPTARCLDTDVVDLAHEAGLNVDAWTVTTPSEAKAMLDCDVDAMTVDRWDVLKTDADECGV